MANRGKLAFVLSSAAFQLLMIVLYATTIVYGPSSDASQFYSAAVDAFAGPKNATASSHGSQCTSDSVNCDDNYLNDYYAMFQDVHVMIFVGFGFLMTFLKRYGLSAVSLNLLIAAIVVQWGGLVFAYLNFRNDHGVAMIDITTLINAEFAAGTVLISFGAVLGKATPFQLLIMAVMEVIFSQLNQYIGVTIMSVADIGGSLFIHTFGAYFGLAVSTILRDQRVHETDKEGSSYNSDLFSMIGTVFLWIFWPSFNGALAHGTSRNRAVINTYLSLAAATVASFLVSSFLNLRSDDKKREGRFEMVHIQNATLAGGVAVGASADLMLNTWVALTIGTLAGVISVLGYKKMTPRLNQRVHDTCGVNNLHGMPGVLAGLFAALFAATANFQTYGYSLYVHYPQRAPVKGSVEYFKMIFVDPDLLDGAARDASTQAVYQLGALLLTVVIAVFGGYFTGALMKVPKMMHCDDHGAYLFMDEENFIVPAPSTPQSPSHAEPNVELSVVSRGSATNSNAGFVPDDTYVTSTSRGMRPIERTKVPVYGTTKNTHNQPASSEPEYYDGLGSV